MAEMSRYCKAYLAKDFERFEGWAPDVTQLANDTAGEPNAERTTLGEDDILYVHDTYVVTDGIFVDEHIVFDQVTDAWKTFCRDQLDFEVPTLA